MNENEQVIERFANGDEVVINEGPWQDVIGRIEGVSPDAPILLVVRLNAHRSEVFHARELCLAVRVAPVSELELDGGPRVIELLFAIVAILSQPQAPSADFTAAILPCEVAVYAPGEFIGCTTSSEDDAPYAGVVWIDGNPSLETGP